MSINCKFIGEGFRLHELIRTLKIFKIQVGSKIRDMLICIFLCTDTDNSFALSCQFVLCKYPKRWDSGFHLEFICCKR